jgi:hypothetical protein
MTPQRQAKQLYDSAYQLFPQPQSIPELIDINKQIKELNIKTCKCMLDLQFGHPLLWRKTLDLINQK